MEAQIINTIVKNNKIQVGLPESFNNHEVEVIVVMKNDLDNVNKIENYATSHHVLKNDWDNELDNHWDKY